MDFTPHNGTHAVQRTVFAVFFPDTPLSRPLTKSDFDKASKTLSTLPGSRGFQAINIEIDEDGPRQGIKDTGLQLFLSEPDGTPAWLLQVAPNHILVECRIYTRWEYVWQLAQTYLSEAIEAVGRVRESPISISRMELVVTDRFETPSSKYSLSTLLKPNDMVPPKVFESGPAWHVHLGWYGEGAPRALNNVNLDAKPVVDKQEEGPWQVEIMHFQRMVLEAPYVDGGAAAADLEPNFFRMHTVNKSIISGMLTEEMSHQIGLPGTSL